MRAEKARADAAGEPPQTHRRNRLGTPETPLSLEAQRELTGGDDIWQAAKCGRRVVVERLLDEGASVNAPDMFGRTPLHYAGLCGQTSIVNLLCARGATDEDHSIEISSKPAARELIGLYAKAAAPGEAPGGTRRPRPSPQLTRELSQAGKDLLRQGLDSNWPAAIPAKEPRAAKRPPTKGGKKMGLFAASASGRADVVRELLGAGAAVDQANNGITPLFIASLKGHADVVRELLGAGADADLARPSDGTTPLWQASANGHPDVVQALLDAGAAVDQANRDETSPQTPANLFVRGPCGSFCSNLGRSPLFVASADGPVKVVRALLGAGAAVNLAANDGATPLYIAAWHGRLEVVGLLLAHGANKWATSRRYRTSPIDVVCEATAVFTVTTPGSGPYGHETHVIDRMSHGQDVYAKSWSTADEKNKAAIVALLT